MALTSLWRPTDISTSSLSVSMFSEMLNINISKYCIFVAAAAYAMTVALRLILKIELHQNRIPKIEMYWNRNFSTST